MTKPLIIDVAVMDPNRTIFQQAVYYEWRSEFVIVVRLLDMMSYS